MDEHADKSEKSVAQLCADLRLDAVQTAAAKLLSGMKSGLADSHSLGAVAGDRAVQELVAKYLEEHGCESTKTGVSVFKRVELETRKTGQRKAFYLIATYGYSNAEELNITKRLRAASKRQALKKFKRAWGEYVGSMRLDIVYTPSQPAEYINITYLNEESNERTF